MNWNDAINKIEGERRASRGSRSDAVSGYALSDVAQHAVGAVHYALSLGDPTMTAEELRYYIRRIYGAEVDAHLKRHFAHNASNSATPARQ